MIYLDDDILTLQLVLGFVLPVTQLHLNSEGPKSIPSSTGVTRTRTHVSGSTRLH